MNRSYTFYLSLALLFLLSLESSAATFSGRVVDEAGEAVPGVRLGLSAFRVTTAQDMDEPVLHGDQQTETDLAGEFQITDITAPVVQLMLPRTDTDSYDLRRVSIEGVTLYIAQSSYIFFEGFAFAIAPGTDIKNVEILVRPQMRIRGRVLSEDGSPLRNVEVYLEWEGRSLKGNRRNARTRPMQLDFDGYFFLYLEEAARYTISLSYEGQSAESEEIVLEDGQRHDDLVLTVQGDPNPKPEQAVARPLEQEERMRAEQERMRALWELDRQGVWAVNPENRHAYKRIRCETRQEAHDRAREEGAHLVAINDAAEQAWLIKVFGEENFWIGLTDAEGAENPRWDNDEPVTYTNWSASEEEDSDSSADTPNYVVLIGMTGEWQRARQWSPLSRLTERAILEKPSFSSGTPE